MVRHSKEKRLTDIEFERLLQAVEQIDCNWYRLQTRFVVMVAGRLGMRAGEIAHMRKDWVDFTNGRIHIPLQDTCDKGEDGGPCGYCRSLAKSVVEHSVPSITDAKLALLEQGNLVHLGKTYHELLSTHKTYSNNHISEDVFTDRIDDALSINNTEYNAREEYEKLTERAQRYQEKRNMSVEEAIKEYWIPKTEASSREIPFDFDPRIEIVLTDFFEKVDRYPNSRTTVNRRVDDALECAGMDTSACSPHGLRATAASYHAGRGLDVIALQSMFGWVQLDTAMKYVKSSGLNTQRALHEVHTR